MTMKKSMIAVIAGTILSSVFACCHLLDTLYDTANSRLPEDAELFMKPGIVSALSSPALLPISLILFTIIIFAMGIIDQDYPEYPQERSSVVSGIFGVLTCGAVGFTAIKGLLSIDSTPEQEIEVGVEALERTGANISPLYWQICMGLGIGAALALGIISIGFFTGSNMLERSPLLMLMPVLWMCMRLVLTFLEMTSNASISERSAEIVMLIFMTLFTLSLGKFMANMGENASKWAYIYGGITVMFAFATAVSRVVMAIVGSKAQDGQLAQTCTDIAESYGLAPNYGDLAMGIFAVVSLFYISAELREEEENMAFGRKNRNNGGQNMYQQGMNPQGMYQQRPMQQGMNPQGMYQQRPMQQGMNPQGMYQQRPMQQGNMYQQRTMQQGMPPQGMYQQRPMQQGMPPQGMYQQRPMQQGMNPQGMYQQRPMQQGMNPQGMYQQRPMQQGMNPQGMYQQAQQMGMQQNTNGFGVNNPTQTEEVNHAASQHRTRQDRRGMPRSAGMRMADSFEVRTYGGPSINSRKKFGGLDSFRDQMLSGQSALNMQSEELPPPPPPQINMNDEEAAMQAVRAAALEAEDVTGDINELTNQIQQSVERIPEGMSDEAPVNVELEIPDDDAVISVLDDSDDHSDEREYPSAPATRSVTLGSGKHQGTLTDHLAELEEYRRKEARESREERYDDSYDSRYYDERYDEYDDGYGQYADEYEDDYEYDEYEYDDEYEDEYDDEYDEYEDEYDEYDDEYEDEYEEYDDEYDEDDYYDDEDDGYYEE